MVKPEIITVVQAAGIELQEKGNRFWACCPFHAEKTPSFMVDVERQRFHCFGCGASGDSIDFAMKSKGLTFREVCKFLNIQGDGFKASEKETEQRETIRRFRVWCGDYAKLLCESLRMCNQIDSLILSPEQLEIIGLAEMYLKKDVFEYHFSILNNKNDYLKFQLYTEVLL